MKVLNGIRLCPVALLALSLFVGCSDRSRPENHGHPAINIAAAASLTNCFTELGKAFEQSTGVKAVFSFGASGDLARQIENGAPFDVFASADVASVERLENKNELTAGTKAIYARGHLVLWTPPGGRIELQGIQDLTRGDVDRIAVAKPDIAPYGRATVETLQALGIWEKVRPKIVYGENVSQTMQYASTGNAIAAFVPLALVKPNEGRYIEVDEKLHQPIDQAMGVVKASAKQEMAKKFEEFVLGPEGKAILAKYGY